MNIDIAKVGQFFKSMAKKGMIVSMLLAVLGNALLQFLIPGTTILEIALGAILTSLIVMFQFKYQEEKSFLQTLNEKCPA